MLRRVCSAKSAGWVVAGKVRLCCVEITREKHVQKEKKSVGRVGRCVCGWMASRNEEEAIMNFSE